MDETMASVGQAATHRPHLRQSGLISMEPSSSNQMESVGQTCWHRSQLASGFLQRTHMALLPLGTTL